MHDPTTCPDCDLASLGALLQMVLPLEALLCDLDAWLTRYTPALRPSEAQLLRHALRTLAQGVQAIHDRERDHQ